MKSLIVTLLVLTSLSLQAQSLKDSEMPGPEEAAALPPEKSPSPAVVTPWRFGVGASLSLRTRLLSNETKVTGSSEKMTSEIDFENALSLEFEARHLAQHDWGFIGGLTFDREHKLDSGSIKGGTINYSITNTGNPATIQATVLYGSAAYRWEDFYVPFGLNVSQVRYSGSSTSGEDGTAHGGLGLQVGVGYYIEDYFVVEAASRSVGLELKSTTGAVTTDFGKSYLATFLVTGKYLF